MAVAPLVLAFHAAAMLAGGECRPPKDSSDAKLLAFYAAPIAFSPGGNAGALAPGAVRLSIDVTYVPKPSADIQRASYCNRKSENSDLAPIFPRPRLAVGLPGGLYLEGSYLPPVTVMDATPNLGSLALGWTRSLKRSGEGRETWVALRAHATFGKVSGPITCPADALQTASAANACYGTQPSDDSYKPNMTGLEGILGMRGAGKLSGYVGAGYTSIKPRFQVHFQPQGGALDDTNVLLDDSRIAAFAGGSYRVAARASLMAELYSVPKDVTTFRVGASWGLR
ncbi:MAG: hypothetical protein IT359_12265 [Gemmatimonadaceae bacterium]|nr:hypothetical protein [Gemmatimonadaceae bacterium]